MHWSKDSCKRERILQKISQSCKGRISSRKGIIMSEKQKFKISQSKKGKPNLKKRAKVNEENICQMYLSGDSSIILAKKFSVVSQTICRILRRNNIKIRDYKENILNAIRNGRSLNSKKQRNIASKRWRGKGNPRYRHGNSNGYKMIKIDNRWIPEHRYLMEQKIRRKLKSDEIVHHINHNKKDNRISNLQIMTISEHISHHQKGISEKQSTLTIT